MKVSIDSTRGDRPITMPRLPGSLAAPRSGGDRPVNDVCIQPLAVDMVNDNYSGRSGPSGILGILCTHIIPA